MKRLPLVVAGLAMTALLAACDPQPEPFNPAAGMCPYGTTDCVDAPLEDDPAGAIRSLLGVAQEDLGDDVRIARVDDELFPLTEDYVLGRITVEIDDGLVTVVTLEHEDGPVTVTA